jgi:molybdopterin synthase catalytic subunit
MKQTSQVEIDITDIPLQLELLNQVVQASDGDIGASVVFTGNVRTATEGDGLIAMTLEHYPGMTEHQLAKIVNRAQKRWNLSRIVIAHRIGKLWAGDPIVYIAVSGLHRKECFEAAQFIMDYLKNDATFWKKEHYSQACGDSEVWVEAKQSDLDSVEKWQ